jgi:cell wall-associated NlpC family hydrolase
MELPRPRRVPRKIPLWAWYMDAWIRGGKQAPRPRSAPKRMPAWFHIWRLWRLARAKGKGSTAWKRYKAATTPSRAALERTAVTKWAQWGVAHEPEVHYSETTVRDDYLQGKAGTLPLTTDCSGFVTYCYWAAGLPDPSGLGYRWLGYTGTLLANAAAHGHITSDVSKALPGDPIVIGPGTGWHVVICVEAGVDPTVDSHGQESGPSHQQLSVDPRQPRRVCQLLGRS